MNAKGTVAIIAMSLVLAMPTAAASAAGFSQQATLTPSGEDVERSLGQPGELSFDGNTALIGGPNNDGGVGAAWLFTRKGSTWTEEAKVTGGGEEGQGNFGASVALSADGKTALIGAPADNNGLGAAWLFTRSGHAWRQRGAKLTGRGEDVRCAPENALCVPGAGQFGSAVALSSNADTALIGAARDDEGDGAVWVFTRSGQAWTQQGEKLTGEGEENALGGHQREHPNIGGRFGSSVALSSDGDTALIGAPLNHTEEREYGLISGGGAWVFTRTGSNWAGEQIHGGSATEPNYSGLEFGKSVALSAAGDVALVGAPKAGYGFAESGEASVLTRSGMTWKQEAELRHKEPGQEYGEYGEHLGLIVALSADGNLALTGAGNRSWVFSGSGSVWTQEIAPLPGGGGVALSGDASTALLVPVVFVGSGPRR
jgi:hypothetical protein